MGDTMGSFGSSMASLFFLWATFQQIFPEHLKIAIKEFFLSTIQQLSFVQRFSDRVINFFSPYVVISFPEYEEYRFNHAFAAIDTYLGAKAIGKAHKIRASQVKESKGLVLKRDEAKVRDVYQGLNVWWEIVTATDGDRIHKLTFHRRGLEIVTGSYIKYVMEEGKSIEAKNKKMKLFTNNPSLNWDNSKKSLWRHIDFEHPASFQTLAMDPVKKEDILNDLEAFSNGKEYYKKIGKAWKRGYLLYGPPGTGKSTMIAAMANHLNYNIYDLELTAIQNNSELRKLLTATSSRSIIVIEDIDCSVGLTGKRRKRDGDLGVKKDGEDQNQSRLTLSGLLNFIDGIWSACGQERIIIFTTNHIEKLDPALIRRGRMDMHIELSYCSFEAFKVLAKNYLDLDSHPLFGEIKSLLKETKIAPADVAEKLMAESHKVDVDGSLKDLVESLEKRKKHQRDHKLSGKKLRIFRELFRIMSHHKQKVN
ncbi:P-loop containing nucleoside triphosphate hydrolases superfamily protein [Raphanus sativus]|uniref:AAA-ATPase At3g28610-like n=1 Tax=Raphanus sativus TaxID=3726 RepID=A0A6J0L0Y2_RAPSA|nr:AAA-ATPase At3g28610-like [Raphanus sativus]KAJ4875165.1 P-loop containing nucleoside triphosphate hydrolases superfamily protein [Raphanus sativus]